MIIPNHFLRVDTASTITCLVFPSLSEWPTMFIFPLPTILSLKIPQTPALPDVGKTEIGPLSSKM